jgi:trehalose 6-phosphate synthase
MNLVAKEYVACQDAKDPGVLVLSRFAGAAQELTEALLVNPADTQEVADALAQALAMPLRERRSRWRAMMDVLEKHDLGAWREAFLDALYAIAPANQSAQSGTRQSRLAKRPLAMPSRRHE